jgi:F420-non-reducing hydrogenase small subunit
MSEEKQKIKLALYWAASCGGCEIAVLDVDEKILDITAVADIVFWPVAIDIKYKDVEAMPDGAIDVCLFNGGIRTSENEHMAKLLRKKSKVLVAFGACACGGSIPGLANLTTKDAIFNTAYIDTISTSNPEKIFPKVSTKVEEGELTLPDFLGTLKTLDQTVNVDYYIPGCPPPVKVIASAIFGVLNVLSQAVHPVGRLIETGKLPPIGSVLAPLTAVCDECSREKVDMKIEEFKRPYEIEADPEKCFLNQGVICMGMATRSGCDAQCLNANWPCTGCGGPTPNALDQGMSMLSAISSMAGQEGEERISSEQFDKFLETVKDPLGTFYMYTLSNSVLKRRKL